jgi:hypothetical protein
MMMHKIEYFEPYVNEFGEEEPSPEWLIVRAQKVDGFAWDDHELYLALHEPAIGFMSSNKDLLHNVTHYHITEITAEL